MHTNNSQQVVFILDASGSMWGQIEGRAKITIAHALQRAAKAMQSDAKKATIVLISDGQTTCKIDPCKTAEALADESLDFRIHVIGFDVAGDSKAKLECIARVSDGKYYAVKTAEGLNSALSDVVEKIKYEKTKPKGRNLCLSASEREGSNQIEASHYIYKIVNGKVQKTALLRIYYTPELY